jgi:hypothetical protein
MSNDLEYELMVNGYKAIDRVVDDLSLHVCDMLNKPLWLAANVLMLRDSVYSVSQLTKRYQIELTSTHFFFG